MAIAAGHPQPRTAIRLCYSPSDLRLHVSIPQSPPHLLARSSGPAVMRDRGSRPSDRYPSAVQRIHANSIQCQVLPHLALVPEEDRGSG